MRQEAAQGSSTTNSDTLEPLPQADVPVPEPRQPNTPVQPAPPSPSAIGTFIKSLTGG